MEMIREHWEGSDCSDRHCYQFTNELEARPAKSRKQ